MWVTTAYYTATRYVTVTVRHLQTAVTAKNQRSRCSGRAEGRIRPASIRGVGQFRLWLAGLRWLLLCLPKP